MWPQKMPFKLHIQHLPKNFRGPSDSTPGCGRATNGLRTLSQCQGSCVHIWPWESHIKGPGHWGSQMDSELSHNVESWVYSWPWKGYKWTQDLLTMSGVLSSLLAVGGPQVDSGPSHNVKFSVILWMWEGLYTKTAMLNVLKT